MEDSAFSDAFCKFLQKAVPTVEAAELLILVSSNPTKTWSAKEAAAAIRDRVSVSEAECIKHIDALVARSLVRSEPERTFKYYPSSEELAGHVKTLAQAYNERPVTLIRMIYALRDNKISSFSDAFRFEKASDANC